MITFEGAMKLANEYLQKSDIPLEITYQDEFLDGWLFCFNSKEYVETGNESAQLAGNGPFFIDKDTGKLHAFGTARPPREYVDEYIKKKHELKK